MRYQGKVSNYIVSLGNYALKQLRIRWTWLQEPDRCEKVAYVTHDCRIDECFVYFKDLWLDVGNADNR